MITYATLQTLSAVIFAVVLSALVGECLDRACSPPTRSSEHYKSFTAALAAIESSYIDKVDSDRLVYGAIRGMLERSTRTRASSIRGIRADAERQEGATTGWGSPSRRSTVSSAQQHLRGIARAHKKGLPARRHPSRRWHRGHQGWTSQQAQNKLGGPKGPRSDS